jgi:serine/threonine protein kinase
LTAFGKLEEVASGLEHLHTLGIIHSSINPVRKTVWPRENVYRVRTIQGNILVDEIGQALLVDFGINRTISHHTMSGSERTMSSKPDGRRYMPPELLNLKHDRCNYSESGEIYSLAMAAFEVNLSYPTLSRADHYNFSRSLRVSYPTEASVRTRFHGALSAANDRSDRPTLQKPSGYQIHYGRCSRTVGMTNRSIGGRPDVCATGFRTRLPHESKASRALEEVRRAPA